MCGIDSKIHAVRTGELIANCSYQGSLGWAHVE